MELYKVVQDKPLEQLAGMTANIAFNQFVFAEPIAPRVTKSKLKGEPFEFTPWDRIDVEEPEITLGGFIALLESKYNLSLVKLNYSICQH